MDFTIILLVIALFNACTNATPSDSAKRNAARPRIQILRKTPERSQGNSQFHSQKSSQPIVAQNQPNPVIYPAPVGSSNGPSFFIPGPQNTMQNFQSIPMQSGVGVPMTPIVPRSFSFPGDPCSPNGGRPNCIASSICSARGACECPYGLAKTKYSCVEPLPMPAPAAPIPMPISAIPQYPIQIEMPNPILTRFIQLPAPQPAPAPLAPMPMNFEMPALPGPPTAAIRWAIVGLIPIRDMPAPIAPAAASFPVFPAPMMQSFKTVPASTVPALTPLIPFPPMPRPMFQSELLSPIPAPQFQSPVPYVPWSAPVAAPAFGFGPPPNPGPVSFGPGPDPYSSAGQNAYPIPFQMNSGPSFSPISIQSASQMDGGDEKKSLAPAFGTESFQNSDAPAPAAPGPIQHSPPMGDSILANDQYNYDVSVENQKDKRLR